MLTDVASALRRWKWSFDGSERSVHRSVEQCLRENSSLPSFQSEVSLNRRDRIDLLLEDGTGIEVKVDGTTPTVLRQLTRYAEHDRVHGLILVSTRMVHTSLPPTILDKPLIVVSVIAI